MARFSAYGQPIDSEHLDAYTQEYLKDKKHLDEVNNQIKTEKVLELLKTKFTVKTRDIAIDEFVKLQ